jgi:hypothetical protein
VIICEVSDGHIKVILEVTALLFLLQNRITSQWLTVVSDFSLGSKNLIWGVFILLCKEIKNCMLLGKIWGQISVDSEPPKHQQHLKEVAQKIQRRKRLEFMTWSSYCHILFLAYFPSFEGNLGLRVQHGLWFTQFQFLTQLTYFYKLSYQYSATGTYPKSCFLFATLTTLQNCELEKRLQSFWSGKTQTSFLIEFLFCFEKSNTVL